MATFNVPLHEMRAILVVEGVFSLPTHASFASVEAMWKLRQSEAYRVLLAERGWPSDRTSGWDT
jgi:hypothetical protein